MHRTYQTPQQVLFIQYGLLFVFLCTCATVTLVAHEPKLLWFITPLGFFETMLLLCFGANTLQTAPSIPKRVTLLIVQSLLLSALYTIATMQQHATGYALMYILICMSFLSAWFGAALTPDHM
jgi:hypothetical protein